jgi:hypothetical protein
VACYPEGPRPGGIQAWPLNRPRSASSLLTPHLAAVDRLDQTTAKSASPFRVRQQPLEVRCWISTVGLPSQLRCDEDVQVRAGRKARDHVLRVQEPAGVRGGGGAPADVGGQSGRVYAQCVAGQGELAKRGIAEALRPTVLSLQSGTPFTTAPHSA